MRFLKVFITSFVLTVIFFFFGGYALFLPEHIWRFSISIALVITALALIFLSMSDEIEELKRRVETLERTKIMEENGKGRQTGTEEEIK